MTSTSDNLVPSMLEVKACGTLVVTATMALFDEPIASENNIWVQSDDMEWGLRDCPDSDSGGDTRGAVKGFVVRRPIDKLGATFGGAA